MNLVRVVTEWVKGEVGAKSQKRSLCAKPRNVNFLLKAVKSYY